MGAVGAAAGQELPDREALGLRILAAAQGAKLALSQEQADGLAQYLLILNRWNRVHSLTAIGGIDEQIYKHLLDSLAAAAEVIGQKDFNPSDVIADVGSGMGAPGIIWAFVMPESRLELIERQQKKSAFLRHLVGQLGLADRVSVVEADVSELGGRRAYGLITSRAFAQFEEFIAMTLGISRPGTRWAAMVGRKKDIVSKRLLFKSNNKNLEVFVDAVFPIQIRGLEGERNLVFARRPD